MKHKTKSIKKRSWSIEPMKQEELEYEMRLERRRTIPTVIYMFVALFIAFLAGTRFYSLFTENEDTVNTTNDDPEVLGEESFSGSEDSSFEFIDKVGYIDGSDLWVYDLDEEASRKITLDGTNISPYSNPSWKDQSIISVSKCINSKCMIKSFDLSIGEEIDNFEQDADSILALRYSHSGSSLVFIKYDGVKFQVLIKDGEKVGNVFSFNSNNSMLTSHRRSFSIRFSMDDSMFLIVDNNSLTDDFTEVVLDLHGKEIVAIDDATLYPSAVFTSNNGFVFMNSGYVFSRDFDSESSYQFTKRIVDAKDLSVDVNQENISYWTYAPTGGKSTVWTYQFEEDVLKRLLDNYIEPEWVNNEHIVAKRMTSCYDCSIEELKVVALDVIDLTSNVPTTIVESENIKGFSSNNN